MDKLSCKACGAVAMMPMDVAVEDADGDQDIYGDESESRFYSCHVCGDNWLSVRQEEEGDCLITFIHQMGVAPTLKRIAHMQTRIVLKENTVDRWEYFLDDQQIDEDIWKEKLKDRREILRSISCN